MSAAAPSSAFSSWSSRLADSPRLLALRGALHSHPLIFTLVVLVTVLSALTPTAYSLATGALINLLTRIASDPANADGLNRFAVQAITSFVAVLGLLFLAQQLLGSVESVAADALGRRYMGGVYRAIMRAALHPPTIRHFEDPSLQDKVVQARNDGGTGPRAAVTGLISWATERFRGAVALLLVAHFSPWLALLLAAVWLHHLHRRQGLHSELIALRFRRSEDMRQAEYQASVLTAAIYAKEVRIFDLPRWFARRYETSWLAAMAGLWARRRQQLPLVFLATLPVLAAEALSLWLVGRAAVLGEIGLDAVVVYAQTIFD